jgi:Domain of unknown function (DUF4351)
LNDDRRGLLVNCVGTYIQLEGEEAARFAAALEEEQNGEVQAMEMTWFDKVEHKGRQQGMQSLILGQMEKRFGPLPAETRKRVEAIDSTEELNRLAARVLDARSLDEMGVA